MPHEAELVQLGKVEAVPGELLGRGVGGTSQEGRDAHLRPGRRKLEEEGLRLQVHLATSSSDAARSSI